MSIHSINASSLKITADFFSFFSSFSFFEKVASRSQNLYRKEKELKGTKKQNKAKNKPVVGRNYTTQFPISRLRKKLEIKTVWY